MKSMKPECDVFSTTLYSDAFSSQYICCVCTLTFVGRFGQKIQFRNNTSEFNQINADFYWLFSQFQQVFDFSHQYFGIYKLIWKFVLKKSGKKTDRFIEFHACEKYKDLNHCEHKHMITAFIFWRFSLKDFVLLLNRIC